MLVAALYGKLETVQRLVEKGASVVATDVFGNTALHKAADSGNLELVKWLIEQNVNVNAANHDGSIPAYIAAVCGHFQIVKCLIDQMDQTSTTEHLSRLFAITAEPELELYTSCIETNDFFRRYSYWASKHERERYSDCLEFLRWLVEEKNLDVHQALWNGWGAVHLVAVGGNVEAMRWLMESHGVDINEPLALNARMVVDDDLFKILDLFVEEDREQKSDPPQWTAMELATASSRLEMVQYLASMADVNGTKNLGWTALHFAALGQDGCVEGVQQWLDHEKLMNIDSMTRQERLTPLHVAAGAGNLDAVQWFVQTNADTRLEA